MTRGAAIVAVAALLVGAALPERERPTADRGHVMKLPDPRTRGGMSLTAALVERRSVRAFSARGLSTAELGQLCWAGQGVTSEAGYRVAPSAGALYPIELFVATADGVGQYDPAKHQLVWRRAEDLRATLQEHALDQSAVGAAPACFVIVADIPRTAKKYGQRAERYCILEAGHVCQNILLQATALGLAGVPIGAFEDAKIARDLDLPESQRAYYLVPVGAPAE